MWRRMPLKVFIRTLDELLNSGEYMFKFMVADIIDSFTGGPVSTVCVIRDVTDYDQPIDYVLVEHLQGQWMGRTLYVNFAGLNDYGWFCVLDDEGEAMFFSEVIRFLRRRALNRGLQTGDLHEAMEYALKKYSRMCVQSSIPGHG